MAGFKEIKFPSIPDLGSEASPEWQDYVIEKSNGEIETVPRWSTYRMRYAISKEPISYSELTTLRRFFSAVEGSSYGFRFEDPIDYTSNPDGMSDPSNIDQEIGLGDGSTRTFQLKKAYIYGVHKHSRIVTKPQTGTVVCAINGAPTSSFTVDTATGIVTFNTAPSNGLTITAGFKYDVPVVLAPSSSSSLAMTLATRGYGALSLELLEMIGGSTVVQDRFHGGHSTKDISSATSVSPIDGALHIITSDQNRDVLLPNPAQLTYTGQDILTIVNNDPTYTLAIRDHADTQTIKSLTPGDVGICCLSKDSSGNYYWHIIEGNV